MIQIKLVIDGEMCVFDPSEEITSLELARLTEFLLCCCLSPASNELQDDFLTKHGLKHHFSRVAE